ncbi:unnamed protein product, partial [Ascophyllum nodosum]
VGEKACLRCVKLDVKSIRGKRTCTKTASVLTFFAVRAETGDRSCWIIVILNRSSLRSFRFGIIVTTFSMVWHTALRYDNTRSRRLHTFYESVQGLSTLKGVFASMACSSSLTCRRSSI